MSLPAWIAIYIFNVTLFGLLFLRRRRVNPTKARSSSYVFATILAFMTGWFLVGLFYPETRLFLWAQPTS
jgi:hypothetical protein